VTNSTISNNHSGDAGGGIDTDGAGTVIINSGTVITGNTDLNQGAGVYVDAIQVGTVFVGAPMTMTGTVVSNNQALAAGITASGGGLFANGPTLTVMSSTFVGNTAVAGGGGLEIETTGTGASGSTITNDTITSNSALNNAGASGGGIDAPATFTGSLTLLDDT